MCSTALYIALFHNPIFKHIAALMVMAHSGQHEYLKSWLDETRNCSSGFELTQPSVKRIQVEHEPTLLALYDGESYTGSDVDR